MLRLHWMNLFGVSYCVSKDGHEYVSGTHFRTFTACTQILVVGESPSRGSYCGSLQQILLS